MNTLTALCWALYALAACITISTCNVINAIADHRRAQATSILQHAGMLETSDDDEND